MDLKRLFKNPGAEQWQRVVVFLLVAAVACFCNLYAQNWWQKFWCMGYAQSLALSTPFSVYAETITVAPSPIAFGLPHVYLMSFLIRAGVSAYWSYDIVFAFWVLLSLWCCIRLCRRLTLSPVLSLVLPLFILTLPSIILHHQYSVLGIGYMLIPVYVWPAVMLFQASTARERVYFSLWFAFTVTVALFMDGYSFMAAMFLVGGLYLVAFTPKNWKWHLFVDPCIIVVSCIIAYILYTKFLGIDSWVSYHRFDFREFRALPVAYFLPFAKGFSILGDYFAYTPNQHPNYMEDFLFCLPLLIADIVLLAANDWKLHRRWRYWLMWSLVLGAFWLSLGPDFFLNSGKWVATGNWFLYGYLPGFKVMRATARWGIVVHVVLAMMLCVSLVRTKLKSEWVVLLLCFVYFLQYLPSGHAFRADKTGKLIEHQLRKIPVKDLRHKLKKGETILFVPLRNNFSQLYYGSVNKVNTWNTGCDKNVRMLIPAYPPEVAPLVNRIHETRALAHLEPFPTALQIVRILALTKVDAVVFDYNAAYSIATPPFRNLLKKDADAIETILKKTGIITVDHSRYFAYYRIDGNRFPAGSPDKRALGAIEDGLGRQYAYPITKLGLSVSMSQLRGSTIGFCLPMNTECWASRSGKLFLQLRPEWFNDDCFVELHFVVNPVDRCQRMNVFVDSRLLKSLDVTSRQIVSLRLEREMLSRDGKLKLEFDFPDATVALRQDNRLVSCCFHSVTAERSVKSVAMDKVFPINNLSAFLTGFSGQERGGRWAGKSCTLRLPLPPGTSGGLRLAFDGWPLTPDQEVRIRDARQRELKTLPLPKRGRYSVVIPSDGIKDDTLELYLDFPRARRPSNGDRRVLSFFFHNLKLSREKE